MSVMIGIVAMIEAETAAAGLIRTAAMIDIATMIETETGVAVEIAKGRCWC